MAAELGVASGAFSIAMLEAGVAELYSIDAWHDENRAHTAAEYFHVVSALRRFGPRSVVLRATFDEALSFFPGQPFSHFRLCQAALASHATLLASVLQMLALE